MIRWILLSALVLWTWCVATYHYGVLRPPDISGKGVAKARFLDKSQMGIHQLILEGDAYGRGLKAGLLERHLLLQEEEELTNRLFHFLPEPLVLALEIPLIRIFGDAPKYLQPWMLEEMYGVSRSAPKRYDRLIDGYTRQLAYHGLHEIGQMMVDQSGDNIGCTVVAAPIGKDWILGRNFDFEGGHILDREKIMKWVFPEEGYAYVSVIWAGMVGGVTAVNEHGLYLSINAAGSRERRRIGTPSTLVLIDVMMRAKTASEALEILTGAPMFITDIFVLLDAKSGQLFRVEKSPQHTEVLTLQGPSVVANHLVADRFREDPINQFRKTQLTSMAREERARKLLGQLPSVTDARDLELPILAILRDKNELPAGNRSAIDSLIATHAVVFNSKERILFVSQGPALAGRFLGFDLDRSFRERQPVPARDLPRDPAVSDELYDQVWSSLDEVRKAEVLISHGDCEAARVHLDKVTYRLHYSYSMVEGDFSMLCAKNRAAAKVHWQEAEALKPAYASERQRLQQRMKE